MTEILDDVGLDPAVPADPPAEPRRWWGRPLAEVRWQAELARLLVDPVFRGEGVQRGDGLPVLLMPGFLAGDMSLGVMAGWLERIGYDPHGSGMVFNVDCSNRAFDAPRRPARGHPRAHGPPRRADRPQPRRALRQGARPPPARARRRRDLARRRAGHPVRHQPPDEGGRRRRAGGAGAAPRRGLLHRALRLRVRGPLRRAFPDGIPLTSIYSRGDGVVWWEACIVPYARNVEVTGSHVGLAFNRKAYRAVAEALSAMAG